MTNCEVCTKIYEELTTTSEISREFVERVVLHMHGDHNLSEELIVYSLNNQFDSIMRRKLYGKVS
jgi:hypothetical protein